MAETRIMLGDDYWFSGTTTRMMAKSDSSIQHGKSRACRRQRFQ